LKIDIHKKEREGQLYESGAGKRIAGHSKLKLCTIFWGHGERDWTLSVQWYLNCLPVAIGLIMIYDTMLVLIFQVDYLWNAESCQTQLLNMFFVRWIEPIATDYSHQCSHQLSYDNQTTISTSQSSIYTNKHIIINYISCYHKVNHTYLKNAITLNLEPYALKILIKVDSFCYHRQYQWVAVIL